MLMPCYADAMLGVALHESVTALLVRILESNAKIGATKAQLPATIPGHLLVPTNRLKTFVSSSCRVALANL